MEIDVRAALITLPAIREGDVLELPLMHGKIARGRTNLVQREADGTRRLAGSVENHPGATFSLTLAGSVVSGRILLPGEKLVYTLESTGAGMTLLQETALSAILCDPYPRALAAGPAGDFAGPNPPTRAALAAVPVLSSRPAATAVLYLDFDGETVSDPDWNGGKTIVAAPSSFTDDQIRTAWRIVSEDYAPFDIDITTDRSRYLAVPAHRRARCIITPTSGWYNDGDSAGVAYRGSFAQGGRAFSATVPCWVFEQYISPESLGTIVSHELGHTLGLQHDGRSRPVEEYYAGHNNWGPIMGSPYFQHTVQWSKGEYPHANNQEDDIAIIAGPTNGFGLVPDEAGASRETATPIAVGIETFSTRGIISGADDVDCFSFTVPTSVVTLNIAPAYEYHAANLTYRCEVNDATGDVLFSSEVFAGNSFRTELGLLAGTYFITITGIGSHQDPGVGYPGYGSVGAYLIDGGLAAPWPPPVILSQPQDTLAYIGATNVSLSVYPRFPGTFRYQWFKDTTALVDNERMSGTQMSTLVIKNPASDDAGSYHVVVTNMSGSATSRSANLSIEPQPPPFFISSPPEAINRYLGEYVSLSAHARARGTGEVAYQWEKDGRLLTDGDGISGASTNTLSISSPRLSHSGTYRVIASNTAGAIYSPPCVLTVSMPPAPAITRDMKDLSVIQGNRVENWSPAITAAGIITYQWYKDGQPIQTAHYNLFINSAGISDSGNYHVVVTNASGSVTSAGAALTVVPQRAPVFTRHPESVRTYADGSVTLYATATGLPAPHYRWKKDGVLLSAAADTLHILNVGEGQTGSYTVEAYNHAGVATSEAAVVALSPREPGSPARLQPASKAIGPARVSYLIRVNGNSSWSVRTDVPWVTVTPGSGHFGGEFEVTVAPNASTRARTATLTVGNLTHTLTQAGAGSPVREAWGMGSSNNNQLGVSPTFSRHPVFLAENIKAVATSGHASYFLKKDGTLWAMGNNDYGQLGNNTYLPSAIPIQTADSVSSIVAGHRHLLFIKNDGTLWGCGMNASKELGPSPEADINKPHLIAEDVIDAAVGLAHVLFIKTDGSVWGLGANAMGQLGFPANSHPNPVAVQLLASGAKAVACGAVHSLVLKNDGTLWGCGSNGQGELGLPGGGNFQSLTQVADSVSSVAAGGRFTAFVSTDGRLWAMGQNPGFIEGGPSISTPRAIASEVAGAATSGQTIFYIKTDGTLHGAGNNSANSLGDGTYLSPISPIFLGDRIAAVATHDNNTLILTDDGTAYSSGDNPGGMLADASLQHPRPVHLGSQIAGVVAGRAGSYLLTTDGAILASAGAPGTTVASVPGGWLKLAEDATSLAIGETHAVLLKRDRTAWGAGYNNAHQLASAFGYTWGNFVDLQQSAIHVSAAGDGTLLVQPDGTLLASGINAGRFGNGSTDPLEQFTAVGSGYASAVLGRNHAVFISPSGTLSGSGDNTHGQLGSGPSTATAVTIANNVRSAAVGNEHTLYIKNDHSLWGAGAGALGQLGAGNTSTPIAREVSQAAAGAAFTLYTDFDRVLWATGDNSHGQLGDGTMGNHRTTPTRIAANVRAFSAGDSHTLFIADGDIRLDPPPPPTIAAFSPATAPLESTLTITGTHLGGTSQVLINGLDAPRFTVDSPTQLSVVVPGGLRQSGPITVATFDGIATTTDSFNPTWPPRIGSQPSDQTVTNGRDITFRADASGSPAVGYQWQRSTDNGATWSAITDGGGFSGAITDTLTIVGATSAMNGHRFRFVATNSLGTLTSDAFSLTVAPIQFPRPSGLAFDNAGNLFVADGSLHTIQKVDTSSRLTAVAGSANSSGATDGTGTGARFNEPKSLVAAGGSLYVSDTSNSLIRVINTSGAVTTLAGSRDNRTHKDGTGTAAWFAAPIGLARDNAGNLFVADSTSHTIRRITSAGVVTTIAGAPGVSGSVDGPGATARFNEPSGLAFGADGHLYVADALNHTIRKIALTPAVTVSTLAGLPETPGDLDGQGFDAGFRTPRGLAADALGNLYVADTGNSAIRKVILSGTSAGTVSSLAGDSMLDGNRDGIGIDAWFRQPFDIALDGVNTLYVADTGNSAIRKINLNTFAVTTLTATEPAPNPDPNPNPNPNPGGGGGTPPPSTPSGGSGGGGGGGAPSLWFLGFLMLIAALRTHRRRD